MIVNNVVKLSWKEPNFKVWKEILLIKKNSLIVFRGVLISVSWKPFVMLTAHIEFSATKETQNLYFDYFTIDHYYWYKIMVSTISMVMFVLLYYVLVALPLHM